MNTSSVPLHPAIVVAAVALFGGGCDAVSSSNEPKRDINGFTELHRAARADDLETVKNLLLYGADPNVADGGGVAPIHRAARDGKYDLVKELVRYSANLDLKTSTGWTALHLAMRSGDVEMVDLLLSYGASLHVPLPDGMPPLSYAISRNNDDIANTILVRAEYPDSLGKTLDMNAKDAEGNTPLHFAVRHVNTDFAISLLVAGADPTITNKANESPFYLAVRDNLEMIAGVMLENGASVFNKTPTGVPIVQYVGGNGTSSMIETISSYAPGNDVEQTL